MKKTVLNAITIAALSLALGGGAFAQSHKCWNNPSKACRDANKAFAEHHGGLYPRQYFNSWYQGNPGRWYRHDRDWRWEGADGDRYWRGRRGWAWHRFHHGHHDDD